MARYDRRMLLGLKLRSSTQLHKMTRNELLNRMQLVRTLEPITNRAYKQVEDEIWRKQLDDSPHGHPWAVSHHASKFPGDDPMACPRQSLYSMMDLPPTAPFTRRSRAIMTAGKAIEVSLVKTYEEAGILLSASPDSDIQTGFELPEVWLTGSVDAIIKPYNWNMPIPIEIKTKFSYVIEEMLKGRGPDKAHISQIKVQLAFVRIYQDKMWPGLDPVTHGYLYYLSRDNPHNTAEFRVDLDQRFFDMGVERLRQWRHYFEEDVLPSDNPSKKHPMGWRWSYRPCSWCDFKPVCKADHEKGTQALSESVGIPRANLVREHYDFDEARKRVKERWKDT